MSALVCNWAEADVAEAVARLLPPEGGPRFGLVENTYPSMKRMAEQRNSEQALGWPSLLDVLLVVCRSGRALTENDAASVLGAPQVKVVKLDEPLVQRIERARDADIETPPEGLLGILAAVTS